MTNSKRGKAASILGKANEHVALGILLSTYPNAMMSSHEQSAHDISIYLAQEQQFIRAQVKTATTSVKLTGGGRGGVDAQYLRAADNPKHYTYSTANTDVVIGIRGLFEEGQINYELYFVPSRAIEALGQKSISVRKIAFTKNNLSWIADCVVPEKVEEFIAQVHPKLNQPPRQLSSKLPHRQF